MENSKYSVVDIETTGLFPGGHDRIIELAVISLDSQGNILNEYETLLNPERDLGPIHIHKITAGMVKNAPKFNEILGNLVELLAGTIIVGHNVSFDYRFLESEFLRAGISLPKTPNLCTLNLTKKVEPNIPSGRLGILCDYFNIQLKNSHSAYADCEATAKLFRHLMGEYDLNKFLQMVPAPLDRKSWPKLPKTNIYFKRTDLDNLPKEKNYIAELVTRLPIVRITRNDGELEYINLLDEILADRRISSSESQLLFEIAMDYNISQEEAIELHRQYFSKLIRIALIDGIISNLEMKDLIQVANLLNISKQVFNQLVSEANMIGEGTRVFKEKSKLSGKTICFTGTLLSNYNGMPITRELAQKLALEHGLVIKKGVTKDLDFLVTADPDTMSGKAKKARDYNVSVLAEQTFWTMLGIQVS